jgi:hypothetical protein
VPNIYPSKSAVRSSKVFTDRSNCFKGKSVKYLRETRLLDGLAYAAKSSLNVEGKRVVIYIVSQISDFSSKRAIKSKENVHKY